MIVGFLFWLLLSYLQAVSTMKEGGHPIQNVEEAVDYVSNRLSADGTSMSLQASQANGSLARQNQPSSGTSKLLASDSTLGSRSNGASVDCQTKIPSKLITNCVATLLMIQVSLEMFFPSHGFCWHW